MIDKINKTMLTISVQGKHGKSPYLLLETGEYYHKRTRSTYVEWLYECFDFENPLSDEELLDKLGFYVVLRLLLSGKLYCRRCDRWSLIIYTDLSGNNPVLKIGEQPYDAETDKTSCAELLLPTLNCDDALENKELRFSVARAILTHLPLQPIPLKKAYG